MSKKELIEKLLERGLLLAPDVIDRISEETPLPKDEKLLYLNTDLLDLSKKIEVNWEEFEKARALLEKKNDSRAYNRFLNYISEELEPEKKVKVMKSYEEISSKKEVRDFTLHFNVRFNALQKILYNRDELKGTTSISRVLAKRDRERVSIIGMVKEKRQTKKGNLMFTVEDPTGEIKVLVNQNKPDLFLEAKDIVLDEVIGISGVNGENIVFANNVLWPDIPMTNQLKRSDEEGYALFISDLHVGSKDFLGKDFDRFIQWLNQETGNERQKAIASKVKYLFILGDLVAGVGVYPNQEEDLTITDLYDQYNEFVDLCKKIPKNIQMIICPGNHDALRVAEPQPPFTNEFTKCLHTLPNTTIVSNPAVINIHTSDDFPGYNILLYHGYSFDYYVANVDSIRNQGGYDRADLIMKFLLKRRHLAPTHTSTQYVPYTDKDPLVVEEIPDIFATGHIHKAAVSKYKNVTLIAASCWEGRTDFQEKVGHHPEPSRVPLVNLQTREVKILRFGK
ncbi:DNA-directed DNA polymerase II small subunit [Candidatus Woesearchaeota archaeon]|nr:DNA-directed DNA polymerase II small subunit [Candidatus Woesearchaeota archaeon]